MTGPNFVIDYLANCPELIDELTRLSWKEWQDIYEQRKQTLEDSLKNYRERMNTNRLPLTLVAVRARHGQVLTGLAANSRELVGMVSLKFHDMDTRPDLDPWLGGLLVVPEWRNRGLGTMLMQRATEEARRLNISRLYLWTHSAEGLYHKLGWQIVERTNYFGKEAVVMQIETDESGNHEIRKARIEEMGMTRWTESRAAVGERMREHRESKQEQDLDLEAMDSRKKPIQSCSDFLGSWLPD